MGEAAWASCIVTVPYLRHPHTHEPFNPQVAGQFAFACVLQYSSPILPSSAFICSCCNRVFPDSTTYYKQNSCNLHARPTPICPSARTMHTHGVGVHLRVNKQPESILEVPP